VLFTCVDLASTLLETAAIIFLSLTSLACLSSVDLDLRIAAVSVSTVLLLSISSEVLLEVLSSSAVFLSAILAAAG
jgi:hypothetical protein